MSSDKVCCVPGCKDSGDMHSALHIFPNPKKDSDRFRKWLYAIGSEILGLENERIYKYRRVCHLHFEDKYKCRYNRISKTAVPTLNIPGPLSPVRLVARLTELRPMKTASTEQLTPLHEGTSSGIRFNKTYIKRRPMQEMVNQVQPTKITDPLVTPLKIYEIPCKENVDPVTIATNDQPGSELASIAAPSLEKKDHAMHSKRKIVKRTKKMFLTNIEKNMHKEIISLRIKLNKIKNKSKNLSAEIRAAKRVVANPAATDFFKSSSSTAKLLIELQARENKKKCKGRRFSLAEKIASLSIFKQSPKGYRLFKQ